MNPPIIESAETIETIASDLLKGSKALCKFPTPVDKIVAYADIKIERGLSLHTIQPNFFEKFDGLRSGLTKLLGMFDFRYSKIYLDHSQKPTRQNFVKLHEVGHKVLSWQEPMYRLDDEKTLDPAVKELFEQEASFFASTVLFQQELFDLKANKLPLEIKSPMALAQEFGASCHAAIRRYVERSKKRCAVFVFEGMRTQAFLRNYFRSQPFAKEFGDIIIPEQFANLHPFMTDIYRSRKFHQDGQCALKTTSKELQTFTYHFFNNSYNAFVFLFPSGEHIKSRTSIIFREIQLLTV